MKPPGSQSGAFSTALNGFSIDFILIEIEDCIQLEIYMKSPICEIYPSQHQDVKDNKIVIQFGLQLEEHISTAVGLTFNFTEV